MPWIDRYYAIRDRWLSSPKFQRWAAAFPLTRPTARRRARALFDLCAGFVYSQILYACVRLKLFELLAMGPQTAAQISAALQLPQGSTERLLEAAVSLQLVERRASGRFGLGALGAAMIGNPAVGAMVEHHHLLYADLHDPVRLLRGEQRQTQLGKYWAYAATDKPASLPVADTAAYTALMGDSVPLVAEEILDAYPLGKHRCLLDVGGGDGSFLASTATRYPHLQVVLFDLPPVAARAAARFSTSWVWASVPAPSAEISCRSRCRGVPMSFPWCAWFMTIRMRRRRRWYGRCFKRCRIRVSYCSRNPCWALRVRDPWARPISVFIFWPWGEGGCVPRRNSSACC